MASCTLGRSEATHALQVPCDADPHPAINTCEIRIGQDADDNAQECAHSAACMQPIIVIHRVLSASIYKIIDLNVQLKLVAVGRRVVCNCST